MNGLLLFIIGVIFMNIGVLLILGQTCSGVTFAISGLVFVIAAYSLDG